MSLKGIDVSSNQPVFICSMVSYDFAIVKATGNPQGYAWDYTNPYMEQQANDAWNRCGRVGLYHFTYGLEDPNTEADFFVNHVRNWIGRAVLVIDYEGDLALSRGRDWVRRFAERIQATAGVRPVIYASGSVIVGQGLKGLGYPLWCANYSKGYQAIYGYDTDGCRIYGGCEDSAIWQFTSQGYLGGYDAPLDLNIFYGTKEDWDAMCGRGKRRKEIRIDCAKVAYTMHADMVLDDDNGYSWDPRHGEDGKGVKILVIDGREYSYDRGSWDCSISIIHCWREAIKYTKYAGALDGVETTHGMRAAFVNSGLFEVWDTQTTIAQPGDVYLNDQLHTAMCQPPGFYNGRWYDDPMSHFRINEHGGVYGGEVGDQTGEEAMIQEYYNHPWNCTLHYNGKANFVGYEEEEVVEELREVVNQGGNIHRLAKGSRHILTADKKEMEFLVGKGWINEGVAFVAPKGGVVPVYRFVHRSSQDHMFTANYDEARKCQDEYGYIYEGVPFFGNETGKPVYRLHKDGQHHFTTDKKEYDALVSKGWKQEGVAWRY